jgi:hypothetical protein
MKNKLKLALVCITLTVVIQIFIHNFSGFNDGFGFGLRDALYFLTVFCSLGILPFFISLYKSKKFNTLMEKENPQASSSTEENWIKHILLRVGIILGICLAFYAVSLLDNSMSVGYLIIFGIVATIVISFVTLVIEAILLARKKLWYKFYCNLAIIGILFFFGINLL